MRIKSICKFVLIFLTLFGVWSQPTRGADHSKFFEATTWTEWQPAGYLKWSKKLDVPYRNIIVTVDVTMRSVLIGVTEQCLRNDKLDVTVWHLGTEFGTQSSCTDVMTTVMTPPSWEDQIGELPYPVEYLVRFSKQQMFMRKPRVRELWRI